MKIKLILPLLLLCFLFACNDTEQARINSVEECFNVKIPECAELVKNNYWGEMADYSFELEFEFDQECFAIFLEKLPKAEKYLELEEENHDHYSWIKNDKSENANMDVFYDKRSVVFFFVHI